MIRRISMTVEVERDHCGHVNHLELNVPIDSVTMLEPFHEAYECDSCDEIVLIDVPAILVNVTQ